MQFQATEALEKAQNFVCQCCQSLIFLGATWIYIWLCIFSFSINYTRQPVCSAQISSNLKMILTQPPANPQALCSCPTGKPPWSNINSVIIASNGHGLMKGGNSALGRRLMDVAILVACSHTDCLLFTFFGPYFVTDMSRQKQELLRSGEEGWHPALLLSLQSHASTQSSPLIWNEAKLKSVFTPVWRAVLPGPRTRAEITLFLYIS